MCGLPAPKRFPAECNFPAITKQIPVDIRYLANPANQKLIDAMKSLSFAFNQKLDYPRDLRSAIVGGPRRRRARAKGERQDVRGPNGANCVLNELSEMCA